MTDKINYKNMFPHMKDPIKGFDGKYCGFDTLDEYWEAFYESTVDAKSKGFHGVNYIGKLPDCWEPLDVEWEVKNESN